MSLTAISLGSNLGDRLSFLEKAEKAISQEIGVVLKRSEIYETQSWGYQGGNFLNMAVLVDTSLVAKSILSVILKIEAQLGRVRGSKTYADRSIDLDILLFDEEIIQFAELEIPHPRIPDRLFVLYPLQDIYPEWIHPILNISIQELIKNCGDQCWIQIYNEPN